MAPAIDRRTTTIVTIRIRDDDKNPKFSQHSYIAEKLEMGVSIFAHSSRWLAHGSILSSILNKNILFCVLMIYCGPNNNTFKLFSREHIYRV